MKSYCIGLAFALVAPGSHALAQEDLIELRDLKFQNDFEERVITQALRDQHPDYLSLFLVDGLTEESQAGPAHDRFYDFLSTIDLSKLGKNHAKQVKLLYNRIHKQFLYKYEIENLFEEIFRTGNYNCVSATALYGLAFEHFGIPYQIKEKPTHVYIVAFPAAERIIVETTNPTGGYYAISNDFKNSFLKTLLNQKLISTSEYNGTGHDQLFDHYYFGGQEDITLQQLVGVQYMNDAIFKLEDGEFDQAFSRLEKAYILYPSRRIGYLMMAVGASIFQKNDNRDNKDAELLGKLSRFRDYGIDPDMVLGDFYKVTNNLLFDKSQPEKLNDYRIHLRSKVRDSTLNAEIDYIYYFQSGRYQSNKYKIPDALTFFEKAFQLKPTNLDAGNAFVSTLGQTLANNGTNQEIIDSLERYEARYIQLAEMNSFNMLKAIAYLSKFERDFSMNRPADGDRYRSKFEALLEKHPDLPVDRQLLGNAYSSAAVYYFKRGQTARARAIIQKGLQLSPDNYELRIRQEMIK